MKRHGSNQKKWRAHKEADHFEQKLWCPKKWLLSCQIVQCVHLVVRKYLEFHGHKRLNHLCFKNILTIFLANFHWVPHMMLITAIHTWCFTMQTKKLYSNNEWIVFLLFTHFHCSNKFKFSFTNVCSFWDHSVKSQSFIWVHLLKSSFQTYSFSLPFQLN